MNPIDHVLTGAARRLFFTRWLSRFVLLLTAAIAGATLYLLVARLGLAPLPTLNLWGKIAGVAGGAVLLASLLWAILTAPKRDAVARQLDEAAGLKEALSTALHVRAARDNTTPAQGWSVNILESATRSARGVRLSAALPVRAPDRWYAPGVAALVMLIAWVAMPKMDLLGKESQAQAQEQKKEEVAAVAHEAKEATKKAESKLEEAMKKLGENTADLGDKKEDLPKPTTPEEIRRAAMKQLGTMQQKIEQMKLGQRIQTASAMADKMKQIRATPGPLEEFGKQLAQGNLAAAQAALENMSKQMAAGKMDDKAMQQAQKQLENMAKQLSQIAQDKKKLEDQLAKNGLDPKLASSPEALKKAMEQKAGLTQEQKQEMQNAAQAQENASQTMQAMAQACQNMASAMDGQKPGQSKDGQSAQQQAQAMQEMANAMSQMEMAQADMQALEAAMSESQSQMKQMSEGMGQCNNPGMGDGNSPGDGNSGQFGQGGNNSPNGVRTGAAIAGNGSGVGEAEDVERWEKRKSRSPLGQGPMIGTMLVQGEQVKGESRAQMIETTEAAAQQATEALEANQVPRELQDPIKRYFGRLAAKVKGEEKPADPAPAKPAQKPEGKPAEKK